MKISVCIPVYNISSALLKVAIDSAFQQEGNFDIELILSDDVSQTDYGELINQYPADVVKFYRNENNLGMVGNWNEAIKRSSGDLIILLGHDDMLSPGMFKAYVEEFRTYQDVVLCSCRREFINEENIIVNLKRFVNDRSNIFIFKEKYVLSYKEVVSLCLRNGNAIGEPSAVMFRKEAFEKVKGYDPQFEHAADVDFNIRVSQYGKVVYFNYPFLRRRIHKDNLTKKNLLAGKVSRDRVRLFEKFHGNIGFSKKEIKSFRANLIAKSLYDLYRATSVLQFRLAWNSLKTAWKFFDFSPVLYISYVKEIITGKNKDAM